MSLAESLLWTALFVGALAFMLLLAVYERRDDGP